MSRLLISLTGSGSRQGTRPIGSGDVPLARTTKPLTNTEVDRARPREKEYSLVDGNGLKLRITPSGGKTWLFNYYRPTDQKRTQIAFGQYPAVSLAQARQQRELARGLLAQGTDPKVERERLARAAQQAQEERTNTLEKVATEWLAVKRSQVSTDHADDIWRSLESHAFLALGAMPVTDITAPAAIEALKPLAAKGSLETVKRVTQRLNEVMNHAVNTGLIHHNPLSGIGKAFKAPAKRQYPALRPEQLSELMAALSTASIKRVTRILIEWQLHTLARPTEAAGARWCEIDEAAKLWRIPAERMKGKRPHIVPLSTQALAMLAVLHPISGHTDYLFPGDRNMHRPCNSSTANMALKRMGFHGVTVAHGLRALGSTTLNEAGHDPDLIESALAHVSGNEVRAAYNRAQYVERRRVMMQWWSDHIEAAATGNFSMAANVGV